jgi:cytoskeletal protein CcmA (bactofilin family)
MIEKKLKALTLREYRFLEDKNPKGIYDRDTRENLYWLIEKLGNAKNLSSLENKIHKKFRHADFGFLIARDSVSGGTLNFEGIVRVDGRYSGEVSGPQTLTVSETGVLVAKVTVANFICKGIVRGNVVATNKAEIHAGGTVIGDIKTPSLCIEEGARFRGKCHMTMNPGKSAAAEKRKRFFLAV